MGLKFSKRDKNRSNEDAETPFIESLIHCIHCNKDYNININHCIACCHHLKLCDKSYLIHKCPNCNLCHSDHYTYCSNCTKCTHYKYIHCSYCNSCTNPDKYHCDECNKCHTIDYVFCNECNTCHNENVIFCNFCKNHHDNNMKYCKRCNTCINKNEYFYHTKIICTVPGFII
jgi:hypothetical protein